MSAESVVNPSENRTLPARTNAETRAPSFIQQVCQCVAVAGLGLVSYLIISHFVLQSVQVVGESMVPTLFDSQQYLLNRWVYHFRAPRRTDVVVLRDPQEHGFAVKRIIAAAGDRVDIKSGKVYVNGRTLSEPYLLPDMPTFPYLTVNEQSFVLGKDQFFVLGDNRRNSADSRTYGPVSRRSILGLIIR